MTDSTYSSTSYFSNQFIEGYDHGGLRRARGTRRPWRGASGDVSPTSAPAPRLRYA